MTAEVNTEKRYVVWWNPSTRTLGGLGWRSYSNAYETRAEAEASMESARKQSPYSGWEIRADPDGDASEMDGFPSDYECGNGDRE